MIKFTAKRPDNRTLMGFGISRGNVERLMAGQPILVNLEEMGLPWRGEVVIFYGENENELEAMILDRVGSNTRINIDPVLKH